MNAEQTKVIEELRSQGFAVVVFTPEELQGVRADKIEDAMVASGWDSIEILKNEN